MSRYTIPPNSAKRWTLQQTDSAIPSEIQRLNLGGEDTGSKYSAENRTYNGLVPIGGRSQLAKGNESSSIANLLPEVELKDGVMDLSKYLDRGEMIDQGAFGEVYKGKWKNLPTPCDNIEMPRVAIKVMRTCRLTDEKQRQKRMKNLRRELYVLQNLAHDHILPLLGTANLNGDENFPAIVSPWMENGTISQYIVKHPNMPRLPFLLPPSTENLTVSKPSIVHGDMKAANVLVNRYGQLFVCDFGLSRMTEDATLWITTATHAGYTTRWAPPELLHPDGECRATMASDVYSYAMTCFEILSGQLPFASLRTEGAVVMAVAMMDKRPDRDLVSDISDDLWDLMTRCWAKNPNDRPLTLDVAYEIKQLLELTTEGENNQDGPEILIPTGSTSQLLYEAPRRVSDPAAPWKSIRESLLNWGYALPMRRYEEALNSTIEGNQVNMDALHIWTMQCYKRDVRARLRGGDPQKLYRLLVPPVTADAINASIFNMHSSTASHILLDLWRELGTEGPPRLLLALARHQTDSSHWVVHSFSLSDQTLTTYDTFHERPLPDGRPLGWWSAIKKAWPLINSNDSTEPVQTVVRLQWPFQSVSNNSVAAAAIWRNILMGSRPEKPLDLEKLRGLINTEVKNLMARKQLEEWM